MRTTVLAGLGLATALAVTGCGHGAAHTNSLSSPAGGGTGDVEQKTAGLQGAVPRTAPAGRGGVTGRAPGNGTAAGGTLTGVETLTGRDLVLTADLAVRVRDVADAASRAERLATNARGYV